MCVDDVGTFLFDEHVPMMTKCVKKVACWELHHMILLPAPTIVTFVVMYEFIAHVLSPSSNLYLHFCVDSSFIMISWTLSKRNIKWLLYFMLHTWNLMIKCTCLCLCVNYASVFTSVYIWNVNVWGIRDMSRCVHMMIQECFQTHYVIVWSTM